MKIKKRDTAFKGYYTLYQLEVESHKTGLITEREQFKTPDSIGVLVHDTVKNKLILVKQFRIGPERELLEIVAGKVEGKDMDLERTVHREVLEEVGYKIDQLTHWYEFYTTPGPVTECMNLYYAQVSKKVEEGGGLAEENEEIEIVEMSPIEFAKHSFIDAKTIIAQQKLKDLLKL